MWQHHQAKAAADIVSLTSSGLKKTACKFNNYYKLLTASWTTLIVRSLHESENRLLEPFQTISEFLGRTKFYKGTFATQSTFLT